MGNFLRSLNRSIKRKQEAQESVYRFTLTEKGKKAFERQRELELVGFVSDGDKVGVFQCDECGRVLSGDEWDERYDIGIFCLECSSKFDDDEDDEWSG